MITWHISAKGMKIWRGGEEIGTIELKFFPAIMAEMSKVFWVHWNKTNTK